MDNNQTQNAQNECEVVDNANANTNANDKINRNEMKYKTLQIIAT